MIISKTQKKSVCDWSVLLLLPLFWGFLLIMLFQLFYPLLSKTIGIGPFCGVIISMFIFALAAPYIHNFFYQVSYSRMAFLWLLFTIIGLLRIDNGVLSMKLTSILLHFLSWQMPAIVFSLIYTLLYAKERSMKMNLFDPSAS